jgi:hypothetical protein
MQNKANSAGPGPALCGTKPISGTASFARHGGIAPNKANLCGWAAAKGWTVQNKANFAGTVPVRQAGAAPNKANWREQAEGGRRGPEGTAWAIVQNKANCRPYAARPGGRLVGTAEGRGGWPI